MNNTYLEQLNLKVNKLATTIYIDVHFYPDYNSNVKRYTPYELYTNKDIYENISLQQGFEIYIENNIKLIVDKIDYQDLPFVDRSNPQTWGDIETLKYNKVEKSLVNYFNKTNKIGSFKIHNLKYANIETPYVIDENITDRPLESLFLEIVAKYILDEPDPAWGAVNGQSLQGDYQYTYNKPFGTYIGNSNVSASLEPGLSRIVAINPPWEALKTNANYPLLALENGEILDINPLQEPISQVSSKIKYKL